MSNIVERLRSFGQAPGAIWLEAAAEIDRLRRELSLLRELHHSAEKEVSELRAELALYKQNYARKQLTDSERRALEGE